MWRPTALQSRKATLERQDAGQPARDLDALAPPGSKARARTQGLPRNLGDLDASGRKRPGTAARDKRAQWGEEKSECRCRSKEAGEPTRRDPAEQRAAPGAWNRKEERWERP